MCFIMRNDKKKKRCVKKDLNKDPTLVSIIDIKKQWIKNNGRSKKKMEFII